MHNLDNKQLIYKQVFLEVYFMSETFEKSVVITYKNNAQLIG